MILPIYLYGQPILREKCKEIDKDYPNLKELIDNMYETMYDANGIGLAAPQIGLAIRLFVVDLSPLAEDNPDFANFKKAFINPQIVNFGEKEIRMEEGCLSIPGINESVSRPEVITIKFYDENFVEHEETYDNFYSRCIQHEYDHIENILFTDKISPVRKQMIKGKINSIVKGRISCNYKIKPLGK